MKDVPLINFSDPRQRLTAVQQVMGVKDGLWWFELRRCRNQRSLSQLAYYWAVVLVDVAAGMSEAWGETVTPEQVHEFCRNAFLARDIINRNTGEVRGQTVPSTSSLDTNEFSEYLDKIFRF